MCRMRSACEFFSQFIHTTSSKKKKPYTFRTSKLTLSWDLGESQTSEDGGSEPNEHLPTSGSGSNAKDHQCGASESD